MSDLILTGVREGSLQNFDLSLPKGKLVALTGVSGSGKSTLAMDVIFQECQRQYLEAIGMQGIRKPALERLRGGCAAVAIAQTERNHNPRSTVGTRTGIYTDLRMVFEKLSVYACPHCGKPVGAARCREETAKTGNDFHVWMICEHCGEKMDKLTRTHFSHNTREGACPTCQGMGAVLTPDLNRAVDEEKSPEEGAVAFWEKRYSDYQLEALRGALRHYGLPGVEKVPVQEFSPLQKALFYSGSDCAELQEAFPDMPPPKSMQDGKFEGVLFNLWRRVAEKDKDSKLTEYYFRHAPCPECGGERLTKRSRSAEVHGKRLPELAGFTLAELTGWLNALEKELSPGEKALAGDYILDLLTKLRRLAAVGLGYLTPDRAYSTLSGGEAQRIRLAASLDSDLTGLLYLLDEPTSGLHPQDTAGLIQILKSLRDLGNTVLVIEHDTEVIRAADHVIELGPGAGKHGGRVVTTGTPEELANCPGSPTGAYLREGPKTWAVPRAGDGGLLSVRNARLHNLQGVDVDFPTGCFTAVTGVSGSGKSTLVFDILAHAAEYGGQSHGEVSGLGAFDCLTVVGQSPIVRMKRSNTATYSGAYDEIRKLFGGSEDAHKLGLSAGDFSFNSGTGRCAACAGMGVVTSNLLFFEDRELTCPTCGGRRFSEKVLSVRWNGLSIGETLELSVQEACEFFAGEKKLSRIFGLLAETGLGYLSLGQPLPTLSGGECQRLKLARELLTGRGKCLYLLDEPTLGLHPQDVEHFLLLLSRLADAGNTVIVVEHDQQVIRSADHLIDLGPGGGNAGGRVVFQGPPREILKCGSSATGRCLAAAEQ